LSKILTVVHEHQTKGQYKRYIIIR